MNINDQLTELYADMGGRVGGISYSTLDYIGDPKFFIPAATLGILGTSIFLMWGGRNNDDNNDDDAFDGAEIAMNVSMVVLSLVVGAFVGMMVMAMGLLVTVGIAEGATIIQDNHRSARPAVQKTMTELDEETSAGVRERYDIQSVTLKDDDWTRMARAHHDDAGAELNTSIEVTVDSERTARWYMSYNPTTHEITMRDAGNPEDAKRVTPHDVVKK